MFEFSQQNQCQEIPILIPEWVVCKPNLAVCLSEDYVHTHYKKGHKGLCSNNNILEVMTFKNNKNATPE